MKKSVVFTVAAAVCTFAATGVMASGESVFKEKCAGCHPDGGNVMNPKETLKGMKDAAKITKKIRKGGGGMPAFDQKSVSDADAKATADYIIKTFKK